MMDFMAARRLERLANHLHQIGPRPIAELLFEIGTKTGSLPLVIELAGVYQRLPPGTFKLISADRFAPLPVDVAPPDLGIEDEL
jgi:hypothetical protein